MSRRADETDKPRDPGRDAGAGDRFDLPLKSRRIADPRTRRHILAKIDALLASRRS